MTTARSPWDEFRRAPLVPWGIAFTAGILLDRQFVISPIVLGVVAVAGMLGKLIGHRLGLLIAWAALAGLWHHTVRNARGPDDIGLLVGEPARLARVRGVLVEEPIIQRQDRDDPLVPTRKPDRGLTVMACREAQTAEGWVSVSGRIRVVVDRAIGPDETFTFQNLHVGDDVEAVGLLHGYHGPANPGENDFSEVMRDRRIAAELRISKSGDSVTRWETGAWWSPSGLLATIRGRAGRVIDQTLAERQAGLARALLLGDGSAMASSDWDRFVRTGVVHVLAISGQHLVILAGFVWWAARVFGLPSRSTSVLVCLLVLGYAAVTGMRPSAVRAAVMVAIVCFAALRRKPQHTANAFTLAWIIVVALDPTDLANTGHLLSFGSVFTLVWGISRWLPSGLREKQPEYDAVEQRFLVESRPWWQTMLVWFWRIVATAYFVNTVLFLANAPLIAARQNIISPIGLLVGPPLVLLTTIALLAGFLLLMVGSIHPTLASPFAALSEWSLSGCGRLVTWADAVTGGSVFVPGPPVWWVLGFSALGISLILWPAWQRRFAGIIIAWFALLFFMMAWPRSSDELRMTFVAVGHGGCTVIECPDGRVIVVDVGSLAGPDAVRRSVAPYLWHRGVRRIDDVFLSHADLDHFNGIPELLRRFPVGRITMTPSFAEKPTPEVASTLAAIRKANVETRIAIAGDRYETNDLTIDVLHPPADGPPGSENERSLVLKLTHAGHTFLLTGDLEQRGTTMVLSRPGDAVDVLMAPHHGSRPAWAGGIGAWARPKLVIVSRGVRTSGIVTGDAGPGVPVWDTNTRGAITLRSHATGLTAESFRDPERRVVAGRR